MDQAESAALMALGERESWEMDDLPAGVDLDVLRCLDELGLLEVLFRYWQSHSPTPSNPATRVEGHLGWFSPLVSPTTAGPWTKIIEHHKRDPSNLPCRLRLNDRGWAMRARLVRAQSATVPDGVEPAKPPRRAKQAGAPLRSYTMPELDAAIREYRTQHVALYDELRNLIHAGDTAAVKRARDVFGRNSLVRVLGVRSGAMVCKTEAWKSIRADLRLGKQKWSSVIESKPANPTLDSVCNAELTEALAGLGEQGVALRESLESGSQTPDEVWETVRLLTRST